jgi:hypothetical protein
MGEIFIEEHNRLREHLLPHERILWTAKPRGGIRFSKADFFMIPFSIFWFGFAIFCTVLAFIAYPLSSLFGLPFIAVGYMMAIGRFLVDRNTRAQTTYALTDSRIIVYRKGRSESLTNFDLATLNYMEYSENKDGSGTIFLSQPFPFSHNLKVLDWTQTKTVPALEFIDEVRSVYQKIMTAQRNRRSSAAPPSASTSAAV